MHGAPSVSYPVGRSRLGLALLGAAWLAGLVVIGAWAWQVQAAPWKLVVGVVVAFAAGASGLAGWWRSPVGTLSWDGRAWAWDSGEGEVEPTLDLQGWLLLRFTGAGGSHWLWLDRARAPQRWDDLRRAVYSRARPQALPRA